MDSVNNQPTPLQPSVQNPPPQPKTSNSAVFIIIALIILAIGLIGGYLIATNRQQPNLQTNISPSPTSIIVQNTPTVAVISPSESPALPTTTVIPPTGTPIVDKYPGWLSYKNDKYGFEIFYPPNYKALDDADNLYGWPKGVVLFYGGGQAYDIAVEVWNSQQEYQVKYPPPNNTLTVKQLNGKYITLLDNTEQSQNKEVIATFTPLQ